MKTQQCDDTDVVRELTRICREADQHFQRVGGGTRHWVRDCFLPALNDAGWCVSAAPPEVKCGVCGEDIRHIDGEWLDRETHPTCYGKRACKHRPFATSQEPGGHQP